MDAVNKNPAQFLDVYLFLRPLSSLDFGVGEKQLTIWFGILALIVIELGLITPPVETSVFAISAQARNVPMSQTFIGVMPFFIAELVRVGLLIAFPALTLWLPRCYRASESNQR